MPRRRFFVPGKGIRDGIAVLPPDQAHHLVHVLRMRPGDEAEVFDGEGNGYVGTVAMRGGEVTVVALRQSDVEHTFGPAIVLAAALIKADRFEWMLQKATELGVAEIVPLQTRLSDIRIPSARVQGRVERWSKIASEAARQCRRNTIPKIHPPTPFPHFVRGNSFPGSGRFLCYEKSADPWNQKLLQCSRVVIGIGPEGGWDSDEVEAAVAAGYQVFSLGSGILRAETAAIVALSLFRLRVSDLGLSL